MVSKPPSPFGVEIHKLRKERDALREALYDAIKYYHLPLAWFESEVVELLEELDWQKRLQADKEEDLA